MSDKVQYQIVVTTVASRHEADTLAAKIIEARLAACVQITAIHSFYRWRGKEESSGECRMEAKTCAVLVPDLIEFIKSNHAYEVPEIIVIPIMTGHPPYLRWISEETLKHSGFTLVEIMIVVAIIGLLVAMALPHFVKIRTNAQNSRFISDLRLAGHAFEQYAAEHGSYPPDAMPGAIPTGMNGYLPKIDWSATTPIGGNWDWDYKQFGNKTGVSVWFGNDEQDARMILIDRIVDNGDLNTGTFQKRTDGYISILEQ